MTDVVTTPPPTPTVPVPNPWSWLVQQMHDRGLVEQHRDLMARFEAKNRPVYGTSTMETGAGDPPAGDPPAGDPPAGDPPAPEPEAPKFTQADLDRYLGERLASERQRHERALQEERARAGKSEVEAAQMERDQALARAGEVTQAAATRIAASEAKVAAQAAGARTDRLAAILKQADLKPAITEDGDVDEAKVKAAVEKVLADYPEWKTQPGAGAGRSGGSHTGQDPTGKPSFTRAQIEGMSPEELAKNLDDINAALADGRVTG